MGSKLANMLAISANSNPKDQAQNSMNADSIGFINTNYTDRFIPLRTSGGNNKNTKKDGEIVSSIQFNQTITDFYSKINPSYSDVSQVTSFFIDKMSVVKNNSSGSRSSALIPVGINLTTDGMGGLSMGQAFTVSQELLPYNYYSPKPGNFIDNYVNKIGFCIVGLSHTIESNTWTTSIRTQMIPVKDRTAFNGAPVILTKKEAEFGFNENNFTGETPNADRVRKALKRLQYSEKGNELSSGGDITPDMASQVIALLNEIKTQYPTLGIEITGGNDIYHKNLNSAHKFGNGIDFKLTNGNSNDVNNVAAFIKQVQGSYGISFLNEYDPAERSANANGNHFHISIA